MEQKGGPSEKMRDTEPAGQDMPLRRRFDAEQRSNVLLARDIPVRWTRRIAVALKRDASNASIPKD